MKFIQYINTIKPQQVDSELSRLVKDPQITKHDINKRTSTKDKSDHIKQWQQHSKLRNNSCLGANL